MSSAAARVFNGCRALLAPAKSSAAASSVASTKAKSKTTKKPRAKSPVKRGAPTRPTGISKVSPVSPALAKFLGAPEASRSDAVRQIWAHVKTHNLQVWTLIFEFHFRVKFLVTLLSFTNELYFYVSFVFCMWVLLFVCLTVRLYVGWVCSRVRL